MAESEIAAADRQEFVSLPMVSSAFGRRKLKVSPSKASVEADVELLQMLGATKSGDIHLALATRLETFVRNVARRVDRGESFDKYSGLLEMICGAYYPGWLILARWYMEQASAASYNKAREVLQKYLESDSTSEQAADVWSMLADAFYKLGDSIGEVHAFIERAQIAGIPFSDLSSTANRLNILIRERSRAWDSDDRLKLVRRLAVVMDRRRGEADSDDLSRMAWLAVHLREFDRARGYVKLALEADPENVHCQKLLGFLEK
jgi:tetratricopeptide (TPR) repeat protein